MYGTLDLRHGLQLNYWSSDFLDRKDITDLSYRDLARTNLITCYGDNLATKQNKMCSSSIHLFLLCKNEVTELFTSLNSSRQKCGQLKLLQRLIRLVIDGLSSRLKINRS